MTSAYSAPFQPHSEGRRPALKPQRMEPIEGPQKESRHVATTPVTITAPCGTCAHEPVCNRIAGLKRLEQVNVEMASLAPGLSVAIRATVDCDAYLRVKGTGHARVATAGVTEPDEASTEAGAPARAKPRYTPEGLANLRANAERNRAKLAEKRAAIGNVTGEPIHQLETVG